MTIPEAVQLVIQAAATGKGGEILVLDMGEPVRDVLVRGTEEQQAVVRTGWFAPHRADEARLVTLYVRR